jgi:anti-sigma factor RsiW
MTCDRCHALIDDYVDGSLPAEELKGIEAHLAGCHACRAMAADFAAIRRSARALEPHVPPPHVWTKLAASLEGEGRRPAVPWRLLAVAATVILLAGGASWILLRQPVSPARSGGAAQTSQAPATNPELVQSVETELKLAEEHYQKAIAGLEQITRTERTALDPQIAAVLQKNLDVIDQAIGESRAALQTQPANEVAQESLFDALRSKVGLLQDTVVLINEMRKGNSEGTARALSGINQ